MPSPRLSPTILRASSTRRGRAFEIDGMSVGVIHDPSEATVTVSVDKEISTNG